MKGRDAGRPFAVVSVIDDGFVLVADGRYHKMNNPKKKNVKHLTTRGENLPQIAKKLEEGKQIFDGELNKALRSCIL